MSGRKLIIIFILKIILFSLSQSCNPKCKTCYDDSTSEKDVNMRCITCASGLFFIFNTTNCANSTHYPDYYLNTTDLKLYPCSIFEESNCYECDPYLNTEGICLSCNKGYIFNNETKECKKYEQDEYAIIINDFDNCFGYIEPSYCDKFITYSKKIGSGDIICPEEAPIFDNLTKSCNEYECINSGIKNGICYFYYPHYDKYKNRMLFINWFYNNESGHYLRYPNFLVDDPDLLLIELTVDKNYFRDRVVIGKNYKRKFYFYNEEGRGFFDEINDGYEKSIKLDKKIIRFFSTSIALTLNEDEKNRYFLNFETVKFSIELLDTKTGDFTYEYLFELIDSSTMLHVDYVSSWVQIIKLKEKNKFIFCSYFYSYVSNSMSLYYLKIAMLTFELSETINEKINIYSLNLIDSIFIKLNNHEFNEHERFFIIQTQENIFFISTITDSYKLLLIRLITSNNYKMTIYTIGNLFENSFFKLLLIKEGMFLLGYYLNSNSIYYSYINFRIYRHSNENKLYKVLTFPIETEYNEGNITKACDVLMLTQDKAVFIARKWHGRRITIYLIDFFDNYHSYIYNKYVINIYEQKLLFKDKYSFIFKYKDILGLYIENTKADNGFILFGYFNSTDPKQIYNIKIDGLNYVINLRNYLSLQSNIFEYKEKSIIIIEVPNYNESGIYLISNNTKDIIKNNDYINLNTEIKINFAYNGTIKKGNYLFKFCGVAEEPTLEETFAYSDGYDWSMEEEELEQEYFEIYNDRRNLNITGRVALVQINVLNDIQVYCDDKYKETAIKTKEGKYITCGDREFYNVVNENKITQINLGDKYHYDSNKKIYIRCHERCKRCSKEYNNTNMNCDECYENYFLRNGLCLENSKCKNNYYYDIEFNLKCINRDSYCPDLKPYEDNKTKECLEKCDIDDLHNNICNPTNNPISINQTSQKILDNINNLNLTEKLLQNKEKFIIDGNNVSFIFSTTEIEKEDLYNIFNGSSIILNQCEDILKNKYSISDGNPIPILKTEIYHNNSNNLEVSYELFNPNNFSEKLDLDLCSQNLVEIRLPLVLKQYKMDLVLRTRDLGYNIFDPNDSFYNDICSIFNYNDSDFSLSERKVLLDLTDEILCMSGCNYSSFDTKTIRTICLCKINDDINNQNDISKVSINNDNNNNEVTTDEFQNIAFSKASNIKVVSCFLIVFNTKLLTENYGFYIMFFMTIINIVLLIFTIKLNFEEKLNIFSHLVIFQMESIYDKIKDEKDLINKDDKKNNKEDNNTINNSSDIDNNNNVKESSINTSSKNENSNIDDNKEISNENSKTDNINNNNEKETSIGESIIENIKESKIHKIESDKELIARDSKNEISNIENIEQRNSTDKNKNIMNNFSDNLSIGNIKEIRDDSSQRAIKSKINKFNRNKKITKIINSIGDMTATLAVRVRNDRTNNPLYNTNNINKIQTQTNFSEKDDEKKIEKLKNKKSSDFYIFYVIKYIPYEERKKYISESEMKDLSYKDALKIDDRDKSDFYFSLLREKNKLISIFLNDVDYNIKTIKISLFIFNFTLSLTVNALFFDDEAIYQINQDSGYFNLSTRISRILYSVIISTVLTFLVELLAFTHNSIIKLRYYKSIKEAEKNLPKLIKRLKFKIILFFIIISVLDIIFFYYISAFCAIYSIIQFHMISNSLISFLLTNSYSIILSLITSIIRIFSLKKETKTRYILYMVSWVISLI